MYGNKYDYWLPILHFVLFLLAFMMCCPSGGEGKISNDRANLTFTNKVMLITKLLTSGRLVSEVHG